MSHECCLMYQCSFLRSPDNAVVKPEHEEIYQVCVGCRYYFNTPLLVHLGHDSTTQSLLHQLLSQHLPRGTPTYRTFNHWCLCESITTRMSMSWDRLLGWYVSISVCVCVCVCTRAYIVHAYKCSYACFYV